MQIKSILAVATASLLPGTLAFYTCFDDSYDDIPAGVLDNTNPVGTYHGLKYTAFGNTVRSAPTGPLAPHSQPNAAATTPQNDVLAGQPSLSAQGSVAIAGNTKSFDLRSFYFSCDADTAEGAASVPLGCSISVNAYYVTGKQVPVATFDFTPDRLVYARPNFAALPAYFVGLKNATIGVAASSGVVADTTLLIDDLVHCNLS